MIDLDLYVDALLSGYVLGVGAGDDSVRIGTVLGSDFIEVANKGKWMRRDYGLIEFNFNQVDRKWVCFGFSIQLHRLAGSDFGEFIPVVIRDHFGGFRSAVKLDALADYMQKRGQARDFICEKTDVNFGYFAAVDVKGTIIVSGKFDKMTVPPVFGDIWSIEVGLGRA